MGGAPVAAAGRNAEDRGDMTVTLVSPASVAVPQSVATSEGLQPLFARFDTGAPPVTRNPEPTGDLDKLFRRLDSAAPRPTQAKQEPAETVTAETDTRPPGPEARTEGAEAAIGGGGLWGVVAPCWKSLASRSTVAVTLEIALDVRGDVSTPPQIVRPPGAVVNEQRLQAEARALAALSTCMARHQPRFGGQVYRLQFRPTRR